VASADRQPDSRRVDLSERLEPRVGHRFTFSVPANPKANFDGIVQCEVLICGPPSELAYSWVSPAAGVDTRVSYRLEPDGGGTRVFFETSPVSPRSLSWPFRFALVQPASR
jgi:hypothetical protein